MANVVTDEEIIRSFPNYQGSGKPGFIIDFLGTETRACYISTLPQQGNIVEGYPVPSNFHATALEWAGVLRAAVDASTTVVAVELGAGWAPWLVIIARAARLRGIGSIQLVGVEASDQHVAYMRSHFIDNGLDPQQHTLLNGVIAPRDGTAVFPVLSDPAANWGAAAVDLSNFKMARVVRRGLRALRGVARYLVRGTSGGAPVKRVTSFSVETVLRPFQSVDLVHVDIQGHEYEVLRSARHVLKQKVKRLVVGTHSRAIERKLKKEMASQNWVLEAEESCKYHHEGRRNWLCMDGCQVWRNPAIESAVTTRQRWPLRVDTS